MSAPAKHKWIAIAAVFAAIACARSRAQEQTPHTAETPQVGGGVESPPVAAVPIASARAEPEAADSGRPARWAVPLAKPGLPNLNRVNDSYYRGAQPSAAGMRELSRIGIKTVINLRSMHSDRDTIGELPMSYEHINFKAWHAEDEDVVRFLRLASDPKRQPVFVHCQHGADRTGMMTAIYRIVIEGWSKDDAIEEMTQGGFGFHSEWQNLVEYLRRLDVDQLRAKLQTQVDD